MGFMTEPDGDTLRVVDIGFLSAAEQAGFVAGFKQRITGYYRQMDQPHSGWFLIPPLLLLGGILWLQYHRCHRGQSNMGV
jgi:hypothetical protein